MKKDTLTVSKTLVIKALLLSFALLTIAFGLGLVIGKTDDSLQNLTSADEGEIREQLSDCSFKLQEITAKHLSLINAAKKKGLMDENGLIGKDVVCRKEEKKGQEKTERIEKTQDVQKSVEDKEGQERTERAEKTQGVQKSVEDKEDSVKKEEPVKKVEQKPKKKMNCSFSIQLFSDPDKDKAMKAKKRYPFKALRLVEAEIRGRSWYRIRYGCYATRAEAELDLPEVKDVVDSAIVVAD